MGIDPEAKLFYGFLTGRREDFGGHYDLDDKFDCTVGILGHDDDLLEFVCVRKSCSCAAWAETKIIKSLDINSNWDILLKQYCDELGIPFQKPQWILGCLYF